MKIAFQNFLTTLKRYKTASILNIAGLTLAFITFYIMMAQVYYGFTYNRSIPDNERIYLVTTTNEKEGPYCEFAPRKTTQKIMQEWSGGELWGFTEVSGEDERAGDDEIGNRHQTVPDRQNRAHPCRGISNGKS